jgi:hypothetical protein
MADLFGLTATIKLIIDPAKIMVFAGILIILGYLKRRFIK